QEFHSVIESVAIAHDCSHAYGIGKCWRELHVNALGNLKFHTGKYQHATFADIAAATVHDGRLAGCDGNCPNGHIELIARPTSRPRVGGSFAIGEIAIHPVHCMAYA